MQAGVISPFQHCRFTSMRSAWVIFIPQEPIDIDSFCQTGVAILTGKYAQTPNNERVLENSYSFILAKQFAEPEGLT